MSGVVCENRYADTPPPASLQKGGSFTFMLGNTHNLMLEEYRNIYIHISLIKDHLWAISSRIMDMIQITRALRTGAPVPSRLRGIKSHLVSPGSSEGPGKTNPPGG